MNKRLATIVFVTATALAACNGSNTTSGSNGGGGVVPQPTSTPTPGGTTAPTAAPTMPPVITPTPIPTATPTVAPQGNLPLSEAVAGSPGWVNPANHRTLYFLDVDTATGGTCTAGCLAVWPVFVPTSGSTATANLTIITRSDGTGQQWAYQGHPLYNFAGDNGPDQANGEGIPQAGGHWHVARPAAATPPPGGTTPPPCVGPYC